MWGTAYHYNIMLLQDVFFTDLQINYRIFLYGDIVYWSVISIFIIIRISKSKSSSLHIILNISDFCTCARVFIVILKGLSGRGGIF